MGHPKTGINLAAISKAMEVTKSSDMDTIKQSTDTRMLLRNATLVVFGGVCVVLLANHIINRMSGWNEPSVFPGFRIMSLLCFPVLYFWLGMLLRFWKENPKWWIQVLVLGISLSCLYRYRHHAGNWWFIGNLCFSVMGFGYLLPPKKVIPAMQDAGWISLLMLLLSVFCYTTIATVKDRLLWRSLIPEHPDMELMMETILVNAEPLMTLVVLYFVVQFAFSRISQFLGAQHWFKGLIAVPCIINFGGACTNLFGHLNLFFIYPVRHIFWNAMLMFFVQPVTIYLIIVVSRYWRNFRKPKKERLSWKEIMMI